MRHLIPGVLGFLLLVPQSGSAQMSTAESLLFFTTDGVELAGTFHPSPRGGKAPSVLFLHKIGGSRQDPGWLELAESLQKKGFSVLRFDFRGHGESTAVAPDFWLLPIHRTMRGAVGQPQKISHEDFTRTAHFAALVNDIAAAKHVLDLKAREGACDSSNVIVIGAESGATLGALWLAAEWQRWRTARDASGKPVKQGLEGHDIACAVWLSITPTLHGRAAVPVETWLSSPVRERVPMGFLYGEKDARASEFSRGLVEKLKLVGGESINKLTGTKDIEGSTLSGSQLLATEDLGTLRVLGNYLDNVLKERRKVVRARADGEVLPPLIVPELFGIR